VPNLPARDFAVTSDFYGGFGFDEAFRDRTWMVLRRGAVELEFFPHPRLEPRESSFMCSIRVADLAELHAAIVAAGVPYTPVGLPRLSPMALRDWGQRAAYLVDIDGTQLNLIEDEG
jgi:hypothetical protein